MQLILNRVRCFAAPGPAEIRPLTILIGENSAGKSSFLALLRMALQLAAGDVRPNFNVEPYFLGAFDQIAHFRGGAYGRDKSFEIGLSHQFENDEVSLVAHFIKSGSQPSISHLTLSVRDASLVMERAGMSPGALKLTLGQWATTLNAKKEGYFIGRLSDVRLISVFALREGGAVSRLGIPARKMKEAKAALPRLVRAYEYFSSLGRIPAYAGAPVRTKPSRTYNPVDDRPQPEGGHVPMVLARTKLAGDKGNWARVSAALNAFGKEAGLFDTLNVKAFGATDSDPFQLETRIGGPPRNIIDVGYGVSQVLPIISDLTAGMGAAGRTYLLQQPEVHLHPKAQAALGTFLVNASKRRGSRIVVETHSDYIIDRIRTEIRAKTIDVSSVSLLFFERRGPSTTIHSIGLDNNGEIVNAPRCYREFFIAETARMLGV